MNSTLLSHPKTLLIDHLSQVASIAVENIQGRSFDFSLEFNDEKVNLTSLLKDLMYLTAAFHDLGKTTVFFQNYIRNPEQISNKRKSHALLSSLFVFYIIRNFLAGNDLPDDLKFLLSVFCFLAVKRHHGNLKNLADELFLEEWQELLVEQTENIDKISITNLINSLIKDYSTEISWDDFINFIRNLEYNEIFEDFSFDFLDNRLKNLSENTRITLYYFYQLLYSSLLFADKNEVILKKQATGVIKTDIQQKINEFRKKKHFDEPNLEIDKLKNQAFFESAERLEKVFNKDRHIYSVTLPTGLGKTITAYMLADKIRKLTGFENAKIIINIPFTSIIDQNFEVYAEIIGTKDSNVLLKHHHLAEPQYKTNENVADFDKSKFLIETWQSDTVVTTFVQFLETLFSCDKAKLMKLSQLAGSVILLDEIQTIPYKLWETIRKGFEVLGRRYNLYFILISATQPLIFTPGEDIIELVPEYQEYFQFFNRTRLIINNDTIDFDYFKTIVSDYIIDNPDKHVLIIMNTKKAAKQLFESIRDEVNTKEKNLYFLTTLITPFERKEIIRRIKQQSEKQKIIVSTQLVEAGVDISVNTVFRQLAPVDSIIQSAGRANRYSENTEASEVYLYKIEEYQRASNMIYGNDLLIKTENVLKEFSEISENEYLEIIRKYFVEVRKQSDNTTNDLLKAIKNFDFADVDLKVIEERKTESVFIQLNEFAKTIWKQYVEIYSTDIKPWEKEAQFSKIKSDFYDFVINVPIPYGSNNIVFYPEKEYNFYVSHLENPSINYSYSENNFSMNTGYNDNKTESILL
jgi:CRISPR-associated endonuclease/helicase Cas3